MEPLGSRDVTLTRRAAGSRGLDGRFVAGASTATTIRASVQPAVGDDLALLAEGQRARRVIKAYTEATVATVDVGAGTPPDLLTVDAVVYEVHSVARQAAILPHYRVIAIAVQEGAT